MQASGIWGWARAWRPRQRCAASSALIAAVAFLTYGKNGSFGFIYDDYWTIVGNTYLTRPLRELVAATLSGLSIDWAMPDATRPMMVASMWIDRQLFGLSPSGYHLHSLALYALVCVLAFCLAFGLLRSFAAALVAGLAFAVLPLHVEVATAINYREDLLAAVGIFGVAALCFWPWRSPWRWQGYACALLWAYALFAKESALILPAVVAVLALVRRPALLRHGVATPTLLLLGAVAVLWSNWRFGVSRLGEQIPTASYASWPERILRAARFELLGAWKSLLPIAPRPEVAPLPAPHWIWALGLALFVAGLVWLARRRRFRVLAAAGGLTLVAPLLTSPLIAPLNEVADRYWFVGSFAAALVIGWAWRALAPSPSRWALAALLVGASVASSKASAVWASEVDLWTFAVQTAPNSARAWSSLARVHRYANQEELAARALARSLSLRPNYLPARTARVLDLLWFGRLAEARRQLDAIRDDPGINADSLRVARRCAALPDAAQASHCARRSVPAGLILGDPEKLRAVSEHMQSLAPPLPALPPRLPPPDAGAADAGPAAAGAAGAGAALGQRH